MLQEPFAPPARQALDRAIEATIRGNHARAVTELDLAIHAEPQCALLHYQLGIMHHWNGRFQAGVAEFSEAIEIDPSFAAAYVCRAHCYENLGQGLQAMADRRKGLSLPGPKYLDLPERFVNSLYSGAFLREARKLGVKIEALLERIAGMPDARVLTYPDGAIQLEGDGTTSTFETLAGAVVRNRAIQLAQAEDPRRMRLSLGSAAFVSLYPFPARQLGLALWGEFAKRYEGGHLRIQPGIIPQPVDGKVNGPIENLRVTVAFQRRLSKQTRQQLAELVGSYLASVRTEGMFGEGPVARVSGAIDFYPRVAQFRIDASRSGQNTINWLILSLVEFSSVNCVTEIHFTEQLNAACTLDRYFGLSSEKLVNVGITEESKRVPAYRTRAECAGRTQLRVVGAEDEMPVGPADEGLRVNGDAQPYEDVSSDYFPILRTSDCIPDDLIVTIFFEQLPKAGERQPIADSIRSWLNLGQLGAFGAPGLEHVGEVEYDDANESLWFFCDLGKSDMKMAIRNLVNTLEGWRANGLVVRSLTLGKKSPFWQEP